MSKRSYLTFAVILPAIFIAADQATKYWALGFFKDKFGTPMDVCGDKAFPGVSYEVSGIFDMTLLCNRGVSFSMFNNGGEMGRWVLTLFALVVTVGLIWYLSKIKDTLTRLAFALLIGGSLGNVIDRIRFGAVVDFLDFSGLHFPYVFNIADSCITAGVIGLLWSSFFVKDEEAKPA